MPVIPTTAPKHVFALSNISAFTSKHKSAIWIGVAVASFFFLLYIACRLALFICQWLERRRLSRPIPFDVEAQTAKTVPPLIDEPKQPLPTLGHGLKDWDGVWKVYRPAAPIIPVVVLPAIIQHPEPARMEPIHDIAPTTSTLPISPKIRRPKPSPLRDISINIPTPISTMIPTTVNHAADTSAEFDLESCDLAYVGHEYSRYGSIRATKVKTTSPAVVAPEIVKPAAACISPVISEGLRSQRRSRRRNMTIRPKPVHPPKSHIQDLEYEYDGGYRCGVLLAATVAGKEKKPVPF